MKRIVKYSLSLAAGWAWGVSLIVGMQTLQQKGAIPFLIWAIANSLALPLFGVISYRIKNLDYFVNSKPIQLFMTLVMIFCLWIQMNCIFEKLNELLPQQANYNRIITIVITLVFVFVLYNDGLERNILIDEFLWVGCYLILFCLLVYSIVINQDRHEIVNLVNDSDVNWALNTVFILFAGPIMNIQNWQMAEKLKKEGVLEKTHILAGVFFGLYMLFVFLLGFFKFDSLMLVIQIFAILCITLTTIDASIVGMQKIAGRKVGTVIAFLSTLLWVFVIPMGILDLWTFMGNRRKEIAVLCIILACIKTWREKWREKSLK